MNCSPEVEHSPSVNTTCYSLPEAPVLRFACEICNHISQTIVEFVEHSSVNTDQAFRFGYSTKNIPIPSQKEVKLQLIHSVRKFFDNLCWRLQFIKNPNHKNERKETYDFKSIEKVPRHEELEPLQAALAELVENIKFRKHNDHFQNKLKNDLSYCEG